MTNHLRSLPAVHELLDAAELKSLGEQFGRGLVVAQIRAVLDDVRGELRAGSDAAPSIGQLVEAVRQKIAQAARPRLRQVINATGILLHTGLGRAPLAASAIAELVAVAGGYASVELDLETGERSRRVLAVEELLCELTGAEAAAVVNNNAGATLLVLTALAAGKEVVVSRGQLIEIGGSFRLPEVMTASGALLKEVGTTNKTRLSDYAEAIGERTAVLMRVHTSNFRIVGFTAEVGTAELVNLGRERNLPVIDDIGSGALLDFNAYGCADEPVAAASIRAGADLALFSGDKLLGGPQCGIIVGRRELIERIGKHPLMRALRVDKLTLAALAATLRLYRDPAKAAAEVPLLRLLGTPTEELKKRAEELGAALRELPGIAVADPLPDAGYLGGGSTPTHEIPSWAVAVSPASGRVDELAARLRTGGQAVVGRVQQDRLWLNLRSVFAAQDAALLAALQACG